MVPTPLATNRLLLPYQTVIGRDFDRYTNHVRRVFLNCLLLDNDTENEEKYAIAAVFHDLGIWTDQTFDYLEPSIKRASEYLGQAGKSAWIEPIATMIDTHHKWTPYRGRYDNLVETFRKADWIDVSGGLRRFGIEKEVLLANRKKFPYLGFHRFLVRSTFRHFVRYPWQNPLPMFKI